MDELDRRIRRDTLKPLVRRSRDRKAVLDAIGRLDNRALGENLVNQVREVLKTGQGKTSRGLWKNPAEILKSVALARALYISRQLCTQEYFFFATLPVQDLVDFVRVPEDSEIKQIHEEIDAIRKQHGLSEDEYRRMGEGPEEYLRLNEKWNARYEKIVLDALREFGLNDIADIKQQAPVEFERLWERGRRSAVHRDEYIPAVRDIVLRHEQDAKNAAAVKAYSAAVTSLGAGVEGLLLLRCLRSRVKAYRIAKTLAKRIRPRNADPSTWAFETLIEVCLKAGWFPIIKSSVAMYNPATLAHVLRIMRNQVHPGRQAREKPWCEIDERDYEDANAIYMTLLLALIKIPLPQDDAQGNGHETASR